MLGRECVTLESVGEMTYCVNTYHHRLLALQVIVFTLKDAFI